MESDHFQTNVSQIIPEHYQTICDKTQKWDPVEFFPIVREGFKKKKNGVGLLQPRYVDGHQPTPNLLFFSMS